VATARLNEDPLHDLRQQAAVAFPPEAPPPVSGLPNYGPDGRLAYLLKLSQAIESRIAYETGWIGQRMTWLVVSQSFLFGAFVSAAAHDTVRFLVFFKWLLALIGLVIATFAYLAIRAAKWVGSDLLTLRSLVDIAIQEQPGLATWPVLGLVRTGLSQGSVRQGSLASHVIPISLIAAWPIAAVIALIVG
jgi:hypothetical protein